MRDGNEARRWTIESANIVLRLPMRDGNFADTRPALGTYPSS